jgi:CPA2 family monovalent cation:H+ antiporter-2
MHPEMPLVVTLAAALGLALVLGFIAARLKLPALVGYLAAGVVIGPHTPGFVADVSLAQQLAEIGVMLLMFGVGMHFSIKDLMAVRKVAVPGAVVQMGVATAMGAALAHAWGWPLAAALVFGLSLSVASTVVLLRALEARNALETPNGRIAVGWLVVEDLAMVLVLVMLPVLAKLNGDPASVSAGSLGAALGKTLLAVGGFVALMLVVGRRVLPWVLWQISRTGSRELFTLCVMAVAVSIAYGASLVFGVSVALGAFFAGLVLRESEFSQRAAEDSLPFRDAFAVLFFVSVGMLFDPQVLLDRPLQVLAVTVIIMVGKSLAAAALVLALRYPLNAALTVSASLAQIGEFSFILIALATSLGLMPPEAMSLVVAGALLSIALNPALFRLVEPLQRGILARSARARQFEQRDDPLTELPRSTEARFLAGHVVLVGHDAAGRRLAETLAADGVPCVVVERSRALVEELRAAGRAAVYGDATDPATLIQAHIAEAAVLVVTADDSTTVRPMIETARTLNPGIRIVAQALDEQEAGWLLQAGVDAPVQAKLALAEALRATVAAQRAQAPVPRGARQAVPGAVAGESQSSKPATG